MENSSNSQTNFQAELVEAQRNLESRFENLNSEHTELKSLLNTLVQQNSANSIESNFCLSLNENMDIDLRAKKVKKFT